MVLLCVCGVVLCLRFAYRLVWFCCGLDLVVVLFTRVVKIVEIC